MSLTGHYADLEKSEDVTPAEKVEVEAKSEYRLYGKRWLILGIFVLYSMSNAMQWIQYSIIANVVSKYYSVSLDAVDWTSMIFMVTYIPLIFPASWLLDKLVSVPTIILFLSRQPFCMTWLYIDTPNAL